MPYVQPGVQESHVNRRLTNISVAFLQDSEAFIANRLFLPLPTGDKSNTYVVYPAGTFNRDSMELRAPGDESAGTTYKHSDDTFNCEVWALHVDVADQKRANTDAPLNEDRDATQRLTEAAMIRRERDMIETFFKTGVWTFEAHGSSSPSSAFDAADRANDETRKWSDSASDPIPFIRKLRRAMQRKTGRRPNVLALGPDAWDTLLDHADIIARLDRGQTPGGPAIAMKDAVAALFELDDILVMEGVYNKAREGVADDVDFINENDGLLVYRPQSAGLYTPAAGYTFEWTGYLGSVENGIEISKIRAPLRKADRIEAESAWDHKLIAADMGCYLHDIA